MVIIQSTGDPGLVTEARIQIIRDIIDANSVISEDVEREIRRIRFAPSNSEKQELQKIDNDQHIPAQDKESEKTKKTRELAALSAYEANRGFAKTVDANM
jgi:hypothetical protein